MLSALLLVAVLAAAPVPPVEPLAQAKTLMRGEAKGQPQARALFEAAAGQGSGPAAYYLGLMLKNGMGGAQDHAGALRWMELAAQRQVVSAMFLAANMLLAESADPAHVQKARFWLEAACDAEYPEALLQKSIALNDGAIGYARDMEQSALFLKMAEHAMTHRGPEP